jgi:hypothetical protein
MVVTAQSTAGLEPQTRSHGAEAFLQKPIEKKGIDGDPPAGVRTRSSAADLSLSGCERSRFKYGTTT